MKFVVTNHYNYYDKPCEEAYIDNSVRILGDTDVYVIDLEESKIMDFVNKYKKIIIYSQESVSMFYTIPEIIIYDDYVE